MVKPVRPIDAPGYKCKANRDGTWREGWEARHDLAKRGYRPSWVRLHYQDTAEGRRLLAARCHDLQGQMLEWAANDGKLPEHGYDGTIKSLIRRFQTDEEGSPYFETKWNTQVVLDQNLKIIASTVGERHIARLLGPDFKRWHKNWGAPKEPGGKPRPWRARHCIETVRWLIGYGVTCGYSDCFRADNILSKLRFSTPAPRTTNLTSEHVEALRPKAHEMGFGSIALATTIQFELDLRQKDVIGEWEPAPLAEGGIVYKGRRWTSGIVWTDIDANMILTTIHTKTGIGVQYDLKEHPAIIAEIAKVPLDRRVGPLIVSEATGEPYKHQMFTRTWRKVANATGIPREVQNRDARAGGISEGRDAGVPIEDNMKLSGHLSQQTHERIYNRSSLPQTRRVAKLRLVYRNQNKGGGRVGDA